MIGLVERDCNRPPRGDKMRNEPMTMKLALGREPCDQDFRRGGEERPPLPLVHRRITTQAIGEGGGGHASQHAINHQR